MSVGKDDIRRRIWKLMDESGISRFPRPVFGRIPNFQGAERAAQKLAGLPEFQSAKVVKVNPDSPQTPVRRKGLSRGKMLVMPSPRLKKGFLVLDPKTIPKGFIGKASTIRGAFRYGNFASIEDLPKIDLVVAGSVAVSPDGGRIGKGGGYSEIEYGILRELELLTEGTPIVTTVHDVQIVEEAPREDHDFSVDAIVTPTRVIRTEGRSQPRGIFWERVTSTMLNEMPILKELKKRSS